MTDVKTELEKRDILRMSNEESNKLTRECLCTALVYLMNEKPFEKITITELVRRSGVSRSAFYRNYSTKEDIVAELTDNVISVITDSLKQIKETRSLHDWFYEAFRYVQENARIFHLLLNANLFNHSKSHTVFSLETVFPPTSVQEHYRLLATESAFYAILTGWFHGGMKESVEFMADLCTKLLTPS